jgi:hypothetical protein
MQTLPYLHVREWVKTYLFNSTKHTSKVHKQLHSPDIQFLLAILQKRVDINDIHVPLLALTYFCSCLYNKDERCSL